mmetsp:Transcript_23918/g.44965  ORF Transcript_23918/g.44965 Transcript_23918/m.44965 type:complete len:493 (+) Transcript_23918:1310-2788(+)
MGALVLGALVLVLAGVEEAANLVDPAAAGVASDPGLLGLVVVLSLVLGEVRLSDDHIGELDGVCLLELGEALVAPMVLVVAGDVVVAVAADALGGAVRAVAVEDRRLEELLLHAAEGAGLAVVAPLGVLGVEVPQHLVVFSVEVLLDLGGHVVHGGAVGVVVERVVERQVAVFFEGLDVVVDQGFDVLLDGAQIHGLFDDFEVVGEAQFHGVDGGVEDPTELVLHDLLQDLEALGLEHRGGHDVGLVERLDVALDLGDREGVDEGLIFDLGLPCRDEGHQDLGGAVHLRMEASGVAAPPLHLHLASVLRVHLLPLHLDLPGVYLALRPVGLPPLAGVGPAHLVALLAVPVAALLLRQGLLVALLQHVHLLRLLVGAVNGLADGHADGAAAILTAMVVGEHVAGGDAVRDEALLVLAFGDVLPQALHARAVRGDGTLSVLVWALRGVTQEQQALLLVTEHLLPVCVAALPGGTGARGGALDGSWSASEGGLVA